MHIFPESERGVLGISNKTEPHLFTVSEMAKIFGITDQTVRFYHKKGLLIPEAIDQNGYRRYAHNQIYTLAMICYLRKANLSIDEIGKYLHFSDVSIGIRKLQDTIQKIRQQQEELQCIVDILEAKIAVVQQNGTNTVFDHPQLQSFPNRYYIMLGSEIAAASFDVFHRYPTLAYYRSGPARGYTVRMGALLGNQVPPEAEHHYQIEMIPAGRYLTVYFKGPYHAVYQKILNIQYRYPQYTFTSDTYCVNIIDQFIESRQDEYVVWAQLQISGEADTDQARYTENSTVP